MIDGSDFPVGFCVRLCVYMVGGGAGGKRRCIYIGFAYVCLDECVWFRVFCVCKYIYIFFAHVKFIRIFT